MKLEDFDFDLPEGLIATRPVSPRSSAKMLLAQSGGLHDRYVTDLVDILQPGDRLVLNNTKVLPARLFGLRHRLSEHGPVEAKVEITLMQPEPQAGHWKALAKPLRKFAKGDEVRFSQDLTAQVVARGEGDVTLAFNLKGDDFDAALSAAGAMPLPPYIAAKRPADARDHDDYQTVFARHKGAVAAPTASLHFDGPLLEALKAKGVYFTEVTLHVGAGTFLPVKVDDVTTHKMHAEWGEIRPEAAEEINRTKQIGGRVIPVGTTALRLLESAAVRTGELAPWVGETDIFIYPGFDWKITDGLMTNFHLPKSTLMMLVSALMGAEKIKEIYAHAIAKDYRFFSYGDSSLLLPD